MGKLPVTVLEPLHAESPVLLLTAVVAALLQFHVAVDAVPEAIDVGEALKVHVGAGVATETVTGTLMMVVPPGPAHPSVNVVLAVRLTPFCGPLAGFTPVQFATTGVALAVGVPLQLQLRFVVPPEVTVVGDAVNVKTVVSAGGTFRLTPAMGPCWEPSGNIHFTLAWFTFFGAPVVVSSSITEST